MGLPSTPYFLCLHYFGLAVTHSYFTTSHTAHGLATSLSPGSFRPVCFLKTYLFILWAYDPLFLPLGLNSFYFLFLFLFIIIIFFLFTNSFSPMLLDFFFLLGFPNEHQQTIPNIKEKNYFFPKKIIDLNEKEW